MQVFIVMVEEECASVWYWQAHRVFSTMASAEAYIVERKAACKSIYDRQEFDILVEEVYA